MVTLETKPGTKVRALGDSLDIGAGRIYTVKSVQSGSHNDIWITLIELDDTTLLNANLFEVWEEEDTEYFDEKKFEEEYKETIEKYAIRCAKGNNGGEWATHYTEEQKEKWRSIVRDLIKEIKGY